MTSALKKVYCLNRAAGIETPEHTHPRKKRRTTMCSPAVCSRCKKITWSGCGAHAEQVLAAIPEDKRCTC
jgi:hypothetical protein